MRAQRIEHGVQRPAPVSITVVCLECVVVVDGGPGVRACRTPVRPGMVIVADGPTG